MLDLQEDISRVYATTERARRDMASRAVKEYFRALTAAGSGTAGDSKAACERALSVLKQDLLSRDMLASIGPRNDYDDRVLAGIQLAFDLISKPLRIPAPPVRRQPKIVTLALSASVGAALGMLGLAPLLRWAYDMRELGFVLGGPLGALVAVLVVHRLSRIRALLRWLPGRSVDAGPISGDARRDHEKVVRTAIEQWLDGAVAMVGVLCLYGSWSEKAGTGKEAAFRRLSKLIYALHRTSSTVLPVVADELIQAARNYGFEGLDGPPVFAADRGTSQDVLVWKKGLQNQYETFGLVAEGDRVTVERTPVIFEGEVLERGLVRKVRGKA